MKKHLAYLLLAMIAAGWPCTVHAGLKAVSNGGSSSGGPPTGSAGGDLGGTYPNPTVVSVGHVNTGTLSLGNGGTGSTQAGNAGLNNLLGSVPMLPHWNKALAKVLSAQGNARVLCLGDSTTAGEYSNNNLGLTGDLQKLSFCGQLTNILNAEGIYASNESDLQPTFTGNTRMNQPSGWGGTGSTIGGGVYFTNNSANIPVFTPTVPVDTFKLCYITQSGSGILGYAVDSGSFSNINENVATSYTCTTISAGSVGFHTLSLKYVSGGNVFAPWLEAYDSTKSQVIIYNGGWPGSKTSDWLTNNGVPWDPRLACAAQNFDLVIIDLQINDMVQGTSLATYTSNLETLAADCQTNGATDVLFMTSNHTNPSDATFPTSEATQSTYAAAVRTAALAAKNSTSVNGVPVVDEFQNLVSYAFQNSVLGAVFDPGTYPYDLHLNFYGYGIMARDLAQVLLPAGNTGGSYANVPPLGRGTFVCTSGGTITISSSNINAASNVFISLNMAGGTISTAPAMKTLTAGTGFTALCATSDTSTYNYAIMN